MSRKVQFNPATATSRPVAFSTEEVAGIRRGLKTTIRLPASPQPEIFYSGTREIVWESVHPFSPAAMEGTGFEHADWGADRPAWVAYDFHGNAVGVEGDEAFTCPLGHPGGELWVCESFVVAPRTCWDAPKVLSPGALGEAAYYKEGFDRSAPAWRSPYHMPRWASRLTLRIKGVKLERLHMIDDAGAEIEMGVAPGAVGASPRFFFQPWWDGRDKRRGEHRWEHDPYVWVVNFSLLHDASVVTREAPHG